MFFGILELNVKHFILQFYTLTFDFQYYGHLINEVAVTTQGKRGARMLICAMKKRGGANSNLSCKISKR